MNPASAPEKPATSPVSAPGMAQVLGPFVKNGTLAGAVTLVAKPDTILSLDTIGYADLAAREPMRPDHLFWIASMTKPMTSTALMMLVDEGKVNVEAPVEDYLPEFKGQMVITEKDDDHIVLRKPQHPILVREVLNHTAGLPFNTPIETPTFDRLSLDQAVRSYAMIPLLSEPGTKYAYSNAGTNTAGRIIEVVSGMPYEQFMDERLFIPLGMKDTTFFPNRSQVARLAKIYKTNAEKTGLEESRLGQLTYPLDGPGRKPLPAGGLFSTATDVLEFCRMILAGGTYKGRKYISPESIRQMTIKQTAPTIENNYGFAWIVEPNGYGHGGAYKTNMTICPDLNMIRIFLVHQDGAWPNADGDNIFPLFINTAEQLARGAV